MNHFDLLKNTRIHLIVSKSLDRAPAYDPIIKQNGCVGLEILLEGNQSKMTANDCE